MAPPPSPPCCLPSNVSPSLLVYSCALLRDILLQGRLYISRNWLCFYANLFGKDIKVRSIVAATPPPPPRS